MGNVQPINVKSRVTKWTIETSIVPEKIHVVFSKKELKYLNQTYISEW